MKRERSWRAQGDHRGLDELVAEDGWIHLEAMGTRDWFLSLGTGEVSVRAWFAFRSDGGVMWLNLEIAEGGKAREVKIVPAPAEPGGQNP